MLLVELMPLGCNLFVQLLAEFRVFGLLSVVRANIHRIFSPLTVVVEVATKISDNEYFVV